MKYEFVEVEEDIIELRYKDKCFRAKRNIELIKEYEEISKKSKFQFFKDLGKQGLSVKDLITEKKEGNKTYVDYSNVDYLQKQYEEEQKINFVLDFCKKNTGMNMEELINDIGLNEKEAIQFGFDFSQFLTGIKKQESFPSQE